MYRSKKSIRERAKFIFAVVHKAERYIFVYAILRK